MRRISRPVVHPVVAGLLAIAAVLLVQTAFAAPAQAFTNVDLSTYKRVGRYDLPEPTRTAAPANNLLAQEASAVTYDWDTETLFVAGDGGTAIVQVSKTGELINTMTLPPGGSPQGTEFYDTEGLAYVGNGEFVFTEERNRAAVRFTYVPGGTLTRAAAKTVKLGTTIGNIGLEGVTNDPITGGYIFVKEIEPKGIFQTGIDWEAGTATNGSPSTVESTNLFNPSLVPTIDFSDVFSLANVSGLTGPQRENLLIISQESGKIVDVNRSGEVQSAMTLIRDPGNPLTIPAQTHEGVTMDGNGVLYTVSENGGGDANHPQLWVFESQSAPNQAPTGVSLTEQTTSLPETTSTSSRLRLAEPVVADDGYGSNQYSVTGADASFFEVDSNGLYLKAGTTLNAATKGTYNVNVSVQDPTVAGSSPVTVPYTLTITSSSGGSSGTNVAVTEVSPWSSGNSSYAADWWELTNTGTKKLDLTGWKMDDDSASAASAVALNGVSSLAPGESAVFIEGTAATAEAFKTAWFGASPPAGFKIGYYAGSGVGLSTGGDQVNVFNAVEARVTGVAFGSSTTGQTFDNAAALGSATAPLPGLTTLSSAGVNGAFTTASGETGSPGIAPVKTPVIVSEAAPWGSGTEASAYAADWWELTNISSQAIDLTGWKMDDESNSFGSAVALNGVSSLAPGESAIFLEGDSTKVSLFKTFWFGSNVPAGVQFGTYSGSGVGLSTGGDQVNVFNSEGAHITGVKFGSSTTNVSFDNAAGLGSYGAPPTISTLSVSGVNGAFVAHDETGSPGTIKNPVVPPPLPPIKITEVSSTSSSNTTYKADFWELTNTGSSAVNIEGWKMDDDSSSFASAVALNGVTSIAAGESAIFIEGTAATAEAFKTAWFGSSVPAGFKIGFYSGSGVGLSSSGDQVNVFNAAGTKVTGVRFGAATNGVSFDNAAGIGSATETPPPLISNLSVAGVNGAFVAGGEMGSPGTLKNHPPVKLTDPTLTGSHFVGASLSCNPGNWEGIPAPTFAYVWLRDGSPIGSATSPSYTTVAADAGAAVSCEVTATNAAGSVAAGSNSIQMPAAGLGCNGSAIAGAGTGQQRSPHQDVWAPAFPVSICPSGPAVTYTPEPDSTALAAWNADGVSGAIDSGLSFIGTNSAPDAGEIANIESAAGGAKVLVIPVAQTATTVVVNPPAGCGVQELTNQQLESIFDGTLKKWSKVTTLYDIGVEEGGSSTCTNPGSITRVVRPDASGTTSRFKEYLAQVDGGAQACTDGSATWSQLADGSAPANTSWPESGHGGCVAGALSPLVVSAAGGAAEVSAVNANDGSVGFAALPDAEAAKAGDTRTVRLQNNGKAKLATFVAPSFAGHANCGDAASQYLVPAAGQVGGSGKSVDWSAVSAGNYSIGGDAYPLCSLTFAVALAEGGKAGLSAGQVQTVKDYLGHATSEAGQTDLMSPGSFYYRLPTSAKAKRDVLGAAQLAAGQITP